MGSLSIWHWVVVLVIVVLVFGTKKLRNVGKDLGGAVHDFKKGLNESEAENKSKPNNEIIDHEIVNSKDGQKEDNHKAK